MSEFKPLRWEDMATVRKAEKPKTMPGAFKPMAADMRNAADIEQRRILQNIMGDSHSAGWMNE